jgi:ATP-dependent helicase YprA (DUF1998 family)
VDVFEVHEQLIGDYRTFTSGAVNVLDERIAAEVQRGLDVGEQWPDPWLSLNPSFASGGSVSELVKAGLLHPECGRIFRSGKAEDSLAGRSLVLYRHQREAIEAAHTGQSYALTTGTGSGKSLAYVIPVVDRVLRERQDGVRKGVKAIIVYPMNALANSQREELKKFLRNGYGDCQWSALLSPHFDRERVYGGSGGCHRRGTAGRGPCLPLLRAEAGKEPRA